MIDKFRKKSKEEIKKIIREDKAENIDKMEMKIEKKLKELVKEINSEK